MHTPAYLRQAVEVSNSTVKEMLYGGRSLQGGSPESSKEEVLSKSGFVASAVHRHGAWNNSNGPAQIQPCSFHKASYASGLIPDFVSPQFHVPGWMHPHG